MNRPKLFNHPAQWLILAFFAFMALKAIVTGSVLALIFIVPVCLFVIGAMYWARKKKIKEWDRINDPRNSAPAPIAAPVAQSAPYISSNRG